MFALTFQSVSVAIENVTASLMQCGNYVIWSAHLESPVIIGANPVVWAEIKYCYVITRERLVRKSIYDQFITTTTGDKIINADISKAPWKAKG